MATLEMLDINSPEVVVRNVRVLDVVGGELLPETDVKVTHGLIESFDEPKCGASCAEVLGEGLTLMPGLIDCHAHILSPFMTSQKNNIVAPWVFRQIGRNLRTNLAAGVVAVRDMLSIIRVSNNVIRRIDKGTLHGPDIIASGAILSCPGGYPEFIHPLRGVLYMLLGTIKYEFTTPRAAEKAVRALHRQGVKLIKVGYSSKSRENEGPDTMPAVSVEVLDAIVNTAHSCGLIVSVHHNWGDDIGRILRSDVDTLEHHISDRVITDEEVELIVKKGIKIITTLVTSHGMAFFDKKKAFLESQAAHELFEPEAREHLHFISRTWLDFNERSYHDVFGYWRANPAAYFYAKESVAKLAKAGVPLLAGTDFGAVVAFSGELAEEIQRLTQVGLSNIDAIRAATIRAAELLGISNEMGSIERGKNAAFILVDGNPLEDITALRRVRLIAKGGRWYKPGGDTTTSFWPEGYELV